MNVKIINNNDRFDDKILALSDRELYQAIGQINESVDELLHRITNAIRNIPFGQNSDESIASKYSSLVQNAPQTEATKRTGSELAKPEVKESRDRKFRLTKDSRAPQVSSSRGHRNRNFVEMSVRSKSSAELGQGFIMTYQK